MHKKLEEFHKKLTRLKKLNPQKKENEDLKEKVKDYAGYIFNKLYCIYKERYNEEKNGLNTKNYKRNLTTKD